MNIQPEEMLTFFSNEYSICISIRNRKVWSSRQITYNNKKGLSAKSVSPFFVFSLVLLCFVLCNQTLDAVIRI